MCRLRRIRFIYDKKKFFQRKSNYYWERFEETLHFTQAFKKGSDQYEMLTALGWDLIDKYLDLIALEFEEDIKHVKN